MQPGDLFVALVGKQADGHQFIPHALRAGAAGLVVSQQVVASLDTPVLRVPDTEVAYGLLARHWRDRFDIPVVGVTGSVGKTTVKEMLAAALSPLGPVLKTEASQNNETGVPKALLQLTPEHKAAVVEMGMRGKGQIAYLCGIARPTVGVLTVIADNHLELLGSLDAIADAKGELLECLPADGVAVLNADDPYLPRPAGEDRARMDVWDGRNPAAPILGSVREKQDEARSGFLAGWRRLLPRWPSSAPKTAGSSRCAASRWRSTRFRATTSAMPWPRWPSPTRWASPLTDAAQALQAYTPPPMRMQVIKTEWGGTILNDAYNAAPASVESALETLAAYGGRPQNRLSGRYARTRRTGGTEAHRELGAVIDSLGGLDALYTVGGLAAQIPECRAAVRGQRRRRPVCPGSAGAAGRRCGSGQRLAGDGDGTDCGGV